MSQDSVVKLIYSVYTSAVFLLFFWHLTVARETPFHLLSIRHRLGLWPCSDLNKGILCFHTAFFSHISCLGLPQRMSLITLMPVRFPTHTDSARSHSICTSACTPTGGVTGVQKASPPGMELQNTSWLSCRAAVCTDSTTSSFWQRNTLYL